MSIVFAAAHMRTNGWRSAWPAAELRRRGYDAYVLGPDEGVHETRGWAYNDTVIIHCTNHAMSYPGGSLAKTVGTLKHLGAKVYVQSDDAYPHLKHYQPVGPWYTELMADIYSALRAADGLIASTPEVADSYRSYVGGSVHVIRNWIPEWVTRLDVRRHDPPVVGWFGFLAGHRQEFDWLGDEIRRLDGRFGVVGDWEGVQEHTGMDLVYTHDATLDPVELYRAVGAFSVGIAPLVDHSFNRGRSWIKPIEYAALGIPCIAARMPSYKESANSTGDRIPWFRADDPAEMVSLAEAMLSGFDLDLGPRMLRADVYNKFTIEGRGGDEWEKWAADTGAS